MFIKGILFSDSFRWPHEAVLLLLAVFKDYENQLTSGKMSVKKFWDKVASMLFKKGYNVTGVQCKSKMTGLKNTYKSVKDHNAKSGNNKRTWRYFDVNINNKFHEIFIFLLKYLYLLYTIIFMWKINILKYYRLWMNSLVKNHG